MSTWQAVAQQLYLALNARPCNCEGKWGGGNWVVTKVCSRCTALEFYRIAAERAEVPAAEHGAYCTALVGAEPNLVRDRP